MNERNIPSAPRKRNLRPFLLAGLAVLGIFAFVAVVSAVASPPEGKDAKSATRVEQTVAPPAEASPSPSPSPVTPTVVNGKGNQAVTGLALHGAYAVDYSFGSWCATASFLKSDGNPGAKLLEDINDCGADPKDKLTGSTIVHLDHVTIVKVSNTNGPWSLTFKPIG